jgi:hypothetical protein
MLALNRSLFNKEYTLINVPKTFASIISTSMCNLQVIVIEDYTEMCYANYKWNIPSIQCKMRLRRSKSVRVK